jgi:hypothetical protein
VLGEVSLKTPKIGTQSEGTYVIQGKVGIVKGRETSKGKDALLISLPNEGMVSPISP